MRMDGVLMLSFRLQRQSLAERRGFEKTGWLGVRL